MFNLPDFIRHTTPSALNKYCTKQNLGINIKTDGEADKNIASFTKSFGALDAEVQKTVQADFEEIGELANEKGSQMLIQKMQEANVTTPKGFEDQSAHDRAIWTYLNQQSAFRSVATHFEVENVEGWVTFRAPFIDKETAIKKKDVLAKAIAGYFHIKEWRGTLCEVDVVEKDGYTCLVCHPQDYAHKEPIFGKDGKLNRSAVYQGTLKVYFLCRPDHGQLKVKARGRLPKKVDLAATFAQTVYEKEINSTDVVKYDLSPIQEPSFTFRPLPEVGVLGADVMSLRISHKGLKSSVQITAWDNTEIETRTQTRAMLQTTYNETQQQLDNLTKMRYRDLIDDATFSRERDTLQKELTKANLHLNETHDRAEKWLELTEQAFHFATNAYAIFMAGDIKTRREVFNTIGTSYVLKDGKLTIEQAEWIVPISNALESIKMDIKRLEPLKKASIYEKTPALAEVYSRWGHIVEVVRTAIANMPPCSYIPNYSLQG